MSGLRRDPFPLFDLQQEKDVRLAPGVRVLALPEGDSKSARTNNLITEGDVMPTIDDIRAILLDFGRRLINGNGADPAKVELAIAKVGRLMATQVIKWQFGGLPKRCAECPIHTEEPDGFTAFGHGNPSADIVLIGQGLGETEAKFGLPFVGIAGALLTMALEDAGIPRETVFLDNTIKCRPKGNRAPAREETQTCISLYLEQELAIIRPRVIVALGASALQSLVEPEKLGMARITKQRGQWFTTTFNGLEYPVLATFHPAYVVRKHGEEFVNTYSLFVSDLALAAARVAAPARPDELAPAVCPGCSATDFLFDLKDARLRFTFSKDGTTSRLDSVKLRSCRCVSCGAAVEEDNANLLLQYYVLD